MKSVEKRWGLKNGRRVTDNCLSVTLPVPRAGIEPARTLRSKGFSCHYGFRHLLRLWSGPFLHRGANQFLLFRCVVSSLCTFLFSIEEAWLKITISVTC